MGSYTLYTTLAEMECEEHACTERIIHAPQCTPCLHNKSMIRAQRPSHVQARVVRAQRAPTARESSADGMSVVASQAPDAAPASAELAAQTLQSILQRAKSLTRDTVASTAPEGEGATGGAHAPALASIQRKSTKITAPATLQKQKSLVFNDSYDSIISLVEAYLDDTNAPETNFGRRLRYTTMLFESVKGWEAEHGPVDQPISSSFFTSTADKRRPLLKLLKESIALEVTQVQDDGLTQAQLTHKADRLKLKEYLDAGAQSDERMLKNTCEWFQLGKAKLYAVTPTGDSEARIAKATMNVARDEAWFPKGSQGAPGDILDAEVKYNERSLTDQTNVVLDPDGKVTGGWNTPGVVVITNPAKASKETVWETLRHEVQHDADFNKGRDAGANVHTAGKAFDVTGAGLTVNAARTAYEATGSTGQKANGNAALKTYEAEVSLTRYKTEYRAYSYEGGESGKYGKLDNSVVDKAFGGKLFTERQLQIFKHIYGGYDYVKTNWDADTPLMGGRTFRDEVIAYRNPDSEAVNKYNSARVDDFYRALDAIGVKEAQTSVVARYGKDVAPVAGGGKISDLTNVGVVNLLAAIEKLHGDDADYIFNESPAMMKKIRNHLDGEALAKVLEELKDMADFSKLAGMSLFD